MTTQFCPLHPTTVMAEIGRVSEDAPIEFSCEFCANGFDTPYIECVADPRDCGGELEIYFSSLGTAIVYCHAHAMAAYRRNDYMDMREFEEAR